jgi:hypothetical protein
LAISLKNTNIFISNAAIECSLSLNGGFKNSLIGSEYVSCNLYLTLRISLKIGPVSLNFIVQLNWEWSGGAESVVMPFTFTLSFLDIFMETLWRVKNY